MNRKAVRSYAFMALAVVGLLTLTACGGGGGVVVTPPPPMGNFTDASLVNNYAFFYQGSDSSGNPLAVSGQFVASGTGQISSGLIDIDDFTTVVTAVPILSSSTYTVNADGQTTVTLNLQGVVPLTLQLTLASSAHGLITEFDVDGSGCGTIDQQNPNALSAPLT